MVDKVTLNQLPLWEQIEKEAKVQKQTTNKKPPIFEGTGELSKHCMEPRFRGKVEAGQHFVPFSPGGASPIPKAVSQGPMGVLL